MAQEADLSSYYVPITSRIANALRTGFGARMKIVYEGDPIDIPVSMLPCIIVQKTGGPIQQDATGLDQQTSVVQIKVIMNKRADFGSTDTIQFTHNELIHLLEGRDPNTAQFMPSSVLGIMRTAFTVGQTIVDQTIQIDYQVGFRPKDLISAEARATFTITELIQVPNRT